MKKNWNGIRFCHEGEERHNQNSALLRSDIKENNVAAYRTLYFISEIN